MGGAARATAEGAAFALAKPENKADASGVYVLASMESTLASDNLCMRVHVSHAPLYGLSTTHMSLVRLALTCHGHLFQAHASGSSSMRMPVVHRACASSGTHIMLANASRIRMT